MGLPGKVQKDVLTSNKVGSAVSLNFCCTLSRASSALKPSFEKSGEAEREGETAEEPRGLPANI